MRATEAGRAQGAVPGREHFRKRMEEQVDALLQLLVPEV